MKDLEITKGELKEQRDELLFQLKLMVAMAKIAKWDETTTGRNEILRDSIITIKKFES
jgi:hypothetical protein